MIAQLLRRLSGMAVLIIALMALWIWMDAGRPYLRQMTPADVDVAPGTPTKRIADQLEAAGVIRSRTTFLALHFLRRKETLKAGMYSFETANSPRNILSQLIHGEVSRQEVTIPEGYNRFDIARLLEERGFTKGDEFLKATADASLVADIDPQAPNLEGYLFPDSYQFPRHSGVAPIVRAMLNRFRRVYGSLGPPDVAAPPREIVTIASMIETETGNQQERPLVASVFYNRLEQGIPLQCDPTVIYAAILNHTFQGTIRQADLNSDSPYNTYAHPGLPPGPIANPGKASLLAALHPAASKYLYFVANATGHHTFSRTLSEHNLAVTLYRRSLARQNLAR